MPKKRPIGASSPLQQAIEDVQPLAETIWSNLAALTPEGERARILFTSTEERAGTTLITAATALGLARNTRAQVTVVEAHLARPAMAGYLGIEPVPGLSDLLVGQSSLEQTTRDVPGCSGLTAIPGGTPRHVIAGEFAADGAREMLELIAARDRYVFFDAPPLLGHAEARALLQHVDGVVLVLRARASRKSVARRTIERIEESGVQLLGSVLNRFKSELPFGAVE
jgi:Mrp family chromosome partitioning ATPase